MNTILLCVLVLAGANAASEAKAPHHAVLWSFDRLQKAVSEERPNVLVLDVRPGADYLRDHIPGAASIDIKAAEKLAARPGGLRDRAAWEAWLGPLGLRTDRPVVIYGENRQLDAARAWWLLTYLGVENVGLADGNYSLWKEQKRPTSATASAVEPAAFAVKFRDDRIATREDVAALLKAPGAARVVDARTAGEYSGAEKRSKKAGHIPSACRLEWSELVGKDGRFLDHATLKAKVDAAQLPPDAPVVTHCQGGGRASVDAFVFERLGHPTRNYYLGWSDWGNAEDTPVEADSKR